MVIVCLFPVLHLWFNQSSILFRKLNSAKNWRRWNEVLQCLDKLEKARRATKIGIGEVEVSHYRALAFAGLGRLDEAVAGFTAAANKSDIPQWLFHVRLVALYSVAKQYGKGLEMYRLAVDEATDKSVVWIDMGSYLVERFSCPEEARLLLALAEKSQLSDQARLFLPKLRSLIAYREKDFATMERQSREALSGFEKQPPKIQYAFEPGILICKGYLAVSCAAQGKKDEARRYFAESGDYLAAICLDEFISRYHALMGT